MIPKMLEERLADEVVWFANAVKLAQQLIAIARKSVAITEDESWIMSLFGTLRHLERHLNPKKLRYEEHGRYAITGNGILRCHGFRLLRKGLDGVLEAYQLTPMCHDGAIFISHDSDAVPPARHNCHRVDEKVFDESPKEHLDKM